MLPSNEVTATEFWITGSFSRVLFRSVVLTNSRNPQCTIDNPRALSSQGWDVAVARIGLKKLHIPMDTVCM